MIGKYSFIIILILSCCTSKRDDLEFFSLSINGRDGDTSTAVAWEVDFNLNTHFHGGYRRTDFGDYEGDIDELEWNSICRDFRNLNIIDSCLVIGDTMMMNDYFEFYYKRGDRIYIWKGEYSELPDNLYSFLEDSYSKVRRSCERKSKSYLFHSKAYLRVNEDLKIIDMK